MCLSSLVSIRELIAAFNDMFRKAVCVSVLEEN